MASSLRTLTVLGYILVGVLLIACLYVAQAIFIPIAVAIFIAFLLSPLVTRLEHWRLPRTAAVIVSVTLAALALVGVVWLLTAQFQTLMKELPNHTQNLEAKIKSIQRMNQGLPTERLTQLLDELMGEAPPDEKSAPEKGAGVEKGTDEKPTPVVVKPHRPSMLAWLASILPAVAGSLGRGGLAIVLALFILLSRGDMRNRLLRLAGHGRIPLTTKVVEDSGQRISRFLVMQLIVNTGFGVALALGLAALGVKYAVLWGFLAALLRYIPYVGVWIAALGPVLLSLALSDGWTQPLLVLGLFLLLEVLAFNLVEPIYYGQNIGVSAMALLVMAAFWAFLWGPIGMVLSSPLTVCLVVLGKYVPGLRFLDVLFGETAPLDPKRSFYQRLLARDRDEALELARARVQESSAEEVYENLFIPALNFLRRDRAARRVTRDDEQAALQLLREVDAELQGGASPAGVSEENWPRRARRR